MRETLFGHLTRIIQFTAKARLATWMLLGFVVVLLSNPAMALRNNFSPWTADGAFQNLVYGGSSAVDVQQALGQPPDEIVRSEQIYPLIENYYYYEANGSGAATVFVFENGLLVGLHYRSPSNQYIDLTSILANNGDRFLNRQLNQGMRGYFPMFPFYSW